MRPPVRFLEIASAEQADDEMRRIGVDPAGARIMAPKQFHYNLKADCLSPAQANVIKQEMLSIGGEAAVARGAAACTVASTGAILSGTLRQFNTLIDKLKRQSFGLPEVAQAIAGAFANAGRRDFVIKGRSRSWAVGAKTLIMGVLNVTPDSFSDGGRYLDAGRAVEKALEMARDGADFIDIGGESTRPGAAPVGADEEKRRVVPVIEALSAKGLAVSIDTTKASVAKAALEAGAEVVNDISALSMDSAMAGVCAGFGAPVVLMHMRGTPQTMQDDVAYEDLVSEVYGYLESRIEFAVKSGIDRENIIIDPGLGFGKSAQGSLELVRRLGEFKALGRPILAGASRKSFIGSLTGAGVDGRLGGTMAVSAIAVTNGASLLRVHDVKEARQAAAVADALAGRAELTAARGKNNA